VLAEHAGLDSVVALGPWIVASTSGPMDDHFGDSAFFEGVGEATDLLIGKEPQRVGVSLGERILSISWFVVVMSTTPTRIRSQRSSMRPVCSCRIHNTG